MDYCFTVKSNRATNPYKDAKWIVPCEDIYTDSTQIIQTSQKPITFDDLMNFLWELPLDAIISKNNEAEPDTITISMDNDDSIIINFDYSKKVCSLRYVWRSGVNPYPEYLTVIPRHDGSLCCIFKRRIIDPMATAKQNPPFELNLSHPFRALAKKLKPYFKNVSTIEFIFKHAYCEEWRKSQEKPKIPFNRDFFSKLDGYTKIFTIEDESFPLIFQDEGTKKRLHSMVYLDGFYKDIINQADFIELDTSFKVFTPYVFSVPTAIISNESFPLGFSIGPSESFEIYNNFYEILKDVDQETYTKFVSLAVLSDEGTALRKLCITYQIAQFFCYRHIIEKFGANSQIAVIVRKLIFFEEKMDFYHYWNTYIHLITSVYIDANEDNKKRFSKLFNTHYDEQSKILTPPNFDEQSLWERGPLHISTSTNHVESAHQKLNAKTRKIRNFMKKIEILLDHIHTRHINASKRPNLRHLIKKITKEDHSKCKQKMIFLEKLYNLEKIPCMHEVNNHIIEIPNDIQINAVTVRHGYNVQVVEYTGKWKFTDDFNPFLIYSLLNENDQNFVSQNGLPNKRMLKDISKDIIVNRSVNISYLEIKHAFIFFNHAVYGYYNYQKADEFIHYILTLSFDQKEAEQYLFQKIEAHSPNRDLNDAKNVTTTSINKEYDYEEDFSEDELLLDMDEIQDSIVKDVSILKGNGAIQNSRSIKDIREALKNELNN